MKLERLVHWRFSPDAGLFLLRAAVGGMMLIGHGLGKLQGFPAAGAEFPDPLGVGNQLSYYLALSGEVLFPALLILGLFTRLSAIPSAITMAVAAFIVHGPHPFFMNPDGPSKELAVMYLIGFVAVALLGPGKWSLDSLLFRGTPKE